MIINFLVFLSFVVNIGLSLLVWFRGRSHTAKLFSLFAGCVGLWCFTTFWFWVSNSPLFWGRMMFIGPIIMGPIFLEFSHVFPNKSKDLKLSRLLLVVVPAVPLLLFLASDFIVKEIIFPSREVIYGLGNSIFGIYFTGCFIFGFVQLLLNWRKSSGKSRNQFRYVFVGIFLSTVLGTTTNLILPLLGTSLFNRIGPSGTVFFVAMVSYAILKHNLLDIEVIIRRTLVFAGLFSFAFGVFAFTTFLTQELLSGYFSGRAGRILSLGVSVLFIVLGYDPLRKFLINLTDRFLFQKKYDYRKLLRDASAGISQIKSLNQLLSLVTHFVTMRIRVKNAAVLLYDEKNSYFKFAYSRGYSEIGWLRQGHIFNESDPLIYYLSRERAPLDIERVREWIETGGPKKIKASGPTGLRLGGGQGARYNFEAIKARMEELEAACCIPSFLGDNLRNVLVLGEKKSSDFYSDEDLQVLFTLAQESAIAIENARLYDQAIDKAKELEAINDQLNTAQSNLIHALDETEVANKKLRDTHAQLIHEQKMATLGRLASSVGHEVNNPLTILSMNVSRAILKHRRDPNLKVSEVLDIFQKMEQNISRIKAVVNTLTGLLKKSEHGKFEPLSLKLILEETLPLVQFQTYLDNLSGTEVNFDIPSNIPLIKGDLERLQEVFLNLFINAYHAMADRRDRKITVTARESPDHPAMVVVEFSDNGAGMSDEVLKKAFSYGFTTKPAGKGSGMGLYMCRYIIELHGGEVKVRSKVGEGTTFVITLPIYYEPTSAAPGESAEV